MTFTGFPTAALDFYDDLEADNSKMFWDANKTVYEDAVKAPMLELMAALGREFGEAKLFRPYRDVRFAKDKTPYKTHQGAFVSAGPATGWYVELAAAGVRVGVGFYDASPARLAAIRTAIDGPDGVAVEKIIGRLTRAGWTVGGDKLKTVPKGYPADHRRIELLRHKTIAIGKSYGFEPVVHTVELLDAIRKDWRAGRPFVEWVAAHVAGT